MMIQERWGWREMRREEQLVNNTDRGKRERMRVVARGLEKRHRHPGNLAGGMKRIGELWRGGQGEWPGDGGGGKEDILGAGI